jgi:two-component sensor histidine kinase
MREIADDISSGSQLAGGLVRGCRRSRSGIRGMTLICRGDASPDFRALEVNTPWASRPSPMAHPRSRFETMVPLAVGVPSKDWNLLGVLLASVLPIGDGGCEVLRPLWAEEAMHRAFGFLRLVHALSRRRERSAGNSVEAGPEDAIACELAARFRELEASGDREVLPCSAVLRDVVTGLGALFGGPANVIVTTKIEDVSLPGYKRRALVLTAVELVGNALLHAFVGREGGRIDVELTTLGPRGACLHVADNGIGFTDSSPNLACGVAAGLAGLLETELAYDRLAGWTTAEIAFPIFALWAGH